MSRLPIRQAMAPRTINVSVRLKEAQDEAGISNVDLAAQIGVTVRLVQKWKAGTVMPSIANLVKMARVFDRELSWFFEGIAA